MDWCCHGRHGTLGGIARSILRQSDDPIFNLSRDNQAVLTTAVLLLIKRYSNHLSPSVYFIFLCIYLKRVCSIALWVKYALPIDAFNVRIYFQSSYNHTTDFHLIIWSPFDEYDHRSIYGNRCEIVNMYVTTFRNTTGTEFQGLNITQKKANGMHFIATVNDIQCFFQFR